MILKTKRLTLRPFKESDATNIYKYAKDERIGPIAGWYPHQSVDDSRNIIKNVLMVDETYAVTINGTDDAIGSIGLMIGEKSNLELSNREGEIGYWIGVPFWGKGLIPEATKEVIRHAFEDLKLETLWCGYFDGNIKSKKAQEKCGFTFYRTDKDKLWPLMNDIRTEHITRLTKEDWIKLKEKE